LIISRGMPCFSAYKKSFANLSVNARLRYIEWIIWKFKIESLNYFIIMNPSKSYKSIDFFHLLVG
jgi:hypothetical protein